MTERNAKPCGLTAGIECSHCRRFICKTCGGVCSWNVGVAGDDMDESCDDCWLKLSPESPQNRINL